MEIDESKTKALTRFTKGKAIPSDHNLLKCVFDIRVLKNNKPRIEVYQVRNKDSLKCFKENTTKTQRFSQCFRNKGSIIQQGKRWMKLLQQAIHKCFKKVRLSNRRPTAIQEKMERRKKIKKEIINAQTAIKRHELEDLLKDIENEISKECDNKNCQIITDQLQEITNQDGTTNNAGIWKLRKKLFPKQTEQLSGKKDKEGNLVTNPEGIKELYLQAYSDRLKHREMAPELLRLKVLREELFHQRLQQCKSNKSPEWKMEDLDKVLKKLKGKKASDPHGLVNELFMLENIGNDLKLSILHMMNKIKSQFNQPEFMGFANITSFWKGKGSKDIIDSERGIFILNILRMIKDRMIYNDVNKVIAMSDSQVGGRTEYNVRNHLFIIYSVLNSAIRHESLPIDIHLYDLCKCFDGLWLEECCNNLYESGITDDKLALIYEGNRTNYVAVKTPGGLTDRVVIEKIVTQGGVTGPLCCSVQTDLIGKDSLNNGEYLYMYKGILGIPSLTMEWMISQRFHYVELTLSKITRMLMLELNRTSCYSMAQSATQCMLVNR